MAQIQVVVVTPESTVFDEMVDSLIIPLVDGAAGVLAGHAPMVGRLGPGELRISAGSKDSSFYVDGGTVQISDNVVSVLTGRSVPVSEIDVAAAKEALKKAEEMEGSNADLAELKSKALNQARTQIRLAENHK
jgi:F-type H+-transporting ATPase subunit epsilon